MNSKIIMFVLLITILGSITIYYGYAPSSNASSTIVCPQDGSLYIWTPIGTFSENFNWYCFQCGHKWIETYPKTAYDQWCNEALDPDFIRDYTLLYLLCELQMDLPDPLTVNWTGGRETPDGILGYETYIYRGSNLRVTIGYPIVHPENTSYTITLQIGDRTVWEGTLHRRNFTTFSPPQNTVYDYSNGVHLFEQGIHVVATEYNPMIRQATLGATNTLDPQSEFWLQLKEHVTHHASTEDFITIILARGDHPTGGYGIHVESFSWLESYPVKFRFIVDFTNPGEDVTVTQTFTNPLVLIPIGNLSSGEYNVEVQINTYILSFDDQGNPTYTVLQTLKAETWTLTFTIK